jgi:hypothetical protein
MEAGTPRLVAHDGSGTGATFSCPKGLPKALQGANATQILWIFSHLSNQLPKAAAKNRFGGFPIKRLLANKSRGLWGKKQYTNF